VWGGQQGPYKDYIATDDDDDEEEEEERVSVLANSNEQKLILGTDLEIVIYR
jgi:hypothetical protein